MPKITDPEEYEHVRKTYTAYKPAFEDEEEQEDRFRAKQNIKNEAR